MIKYYLGKLMFYKYKHCKWAFGVEFHQSCYCNDEYYECEFRIDFWKWSFGIVF
jgi:hypothetical protein